MSDSERIIIGTFPLDILCEIFKEVLSNLTRSSLNHDSNSEASASSSKQTDGPQFITYEAFRPRLRIAFSLRHVCIQWRRASFLTSGLWHTLIWSCKPFWSGISKNDIDFLQWWSENVRGNSLTFNESALSDVIWTQDIFPMAIPRPVTAQSWNLSHKSSLEAFMKLISKAKHLSIDSFYLSFLTEAISGPQGGLREFPHMRTLHIQGHHNDDDVSRPNPMIFNFFDCLPLMKMTKLKSLHINERTSLGLHPFPLAFTHAYMPFKIWSRLTDLTAALSITPVEWLRLIKECTSLITACFSFDIYGKINEAANHQYQLSVSSIPNTHIVLEKLKTLDIRIVKDETGEGFRQLLHCDRFLLPTLVNLSMKGSHLSLQNLHTILQVTPMLRKLGVAAEMQLSYINLVVAGRLPIRSLNHLDGFPQTRTGLRFWRRGENGKWTLC
ncbi:hypothetical protein CPB84DRAFT_1785453 [Gymnopilus junonius]|uniref:F-box domain-containing protein n=1 Tax=Gymnopilus junonius TaxID=109634 RepID=A0A9P5NJ33_GYMJU|nr:hypothetical protein CPB84DRAFT_1785453 [Gymnopilus junonius]